MSNKKENILATQPIGRLMRKFALPAIVSSLVNSIYNIVDQIFIGHSIGPLGNSATNVAFPLVTLSAAITMMIGIGGASNFSLYLGKGEKEKATRIIGSSISMAFGSGLLLCIIVLLCLNPMLVLFGARGEVLQYAREYTGITAFGLPFLIFSSAASQLVRADGSPGYAMTGVLSGAVLNTILDPILIFGFNMGMRGAAIATVTGQVVSAAWILLYFRRFKSLKLQKKHLIPHLRSIRKIIVLGAAAFFSQLAVTIVQIILNNTLGYYGELSVYGRDIPLAVVGIISKVNTVFMSVIYGIAQSCQPIFGFNYGAGNYGRVKTTYKMAARVTTIIAAAAWLCFQLFPRQIISLFGHGNELYFQFGIAYFRIYLFCTFINGIQILNSNFFSSIGKAQKGIVISMSRQILFLLPLILLFPLLFGINGVLYAGPIADGAAAILSIILVKGEFSRMPVNKK